MTDLLTLQRGIRAHLESGALEIASHIHGDPAARLAVYYCAYRSQLLECLRDTFEGLWGWLGDQQFDKIARSYVEMHRSNSWTLGDYGNGFDRFLKIRYPRDPELAELAWLDWSLRRAFDGPDAAPVDPTNLLSIDWDKAVLKLMPTLRVSSISTNCTSIWRAIADKVTPPALARLTEPIAIRVWRHGFSSKFRTIESIERIALLLTLSGASFSTICLKVSEEVGLQKAPHTMGTILKSWLVDGLLVASN